MSQPGFSGVIELDTDIENPEENKAMEMQGSMESTVPDTVIETRGLTMDYDVNTRALDNVDIKVSRGEWVSIMGASGSGKTTLLNIIGCLDTPTNGQVIMRDINITDLKKNELTRVRRENMGFIFQQFHLVPYLTALENVMLAKYFLLGKGEYGEDARSALERVGMGHRLDHIPSHLSGGEQQRVAVARALVNEPEIILADEPTGNLDQENGKIILELLKSLHDEGHTILLITHEPEIGKMGNRIIRLVDGRVVSETRETKDNKT